MKITSILVTALVEVDIFDEEGKYLESIQQEYRAQDLDTAFKLLYTFKSLVKKGATNGVQPQESPKP